MDFMMGCFVSWKCLVACLFFEESQQLTLPHSRHRRRWTQVSPIFMHSSQPLVRGVTGRIWFMCVQVFILFLRYDCNQFFRSPTPHRLKPHSNFKANGAFALWLGSGRAGAARFPSGG